MKIFLPLLGYKMAHIRQEQVPRVLQHHMRLKARKDQNEIQNTMTARMYQKGNPERINDLRRSRGRAFFSVKNQKIAAQDRK